jgi:tRNA pseudouridine32 synthase/23S rRNA pseudouridine746 synthase
MSFAYQPPPDRGLDILYRDEHLIILNKPSGLLSVPGRGEERRDSLAVRVQREFPQALVVHRLDMPTSGLMLMALSVEAQSVMGRLFQQRKVEKQYLAVVAGRPDPIQGEVDLPLITDWPNRPRQRVDHDIGKAALTRYTLLEYDPRSDTSRVLLEPHTGRSHQLRVHMKEIGHPILGDELYAPPRWHAAAPRLLLHAERLDFAHPLSGEPVSIECPADF